MYNVNELDESRHLVFGEKEYHSSETNPSLDPVVIVDLEKTFTQVNTSISEWPRTEGHAKVDQVT